ncbi:MAG: 30S ribosomal protein S8 [Candidatus Aenigmarchaeota archaeon]|nr:30S ribosomal protein S8 [Candidatus Aenigmarchaeota archaeon]
MRHDLLADAFSAIKNAEAVGKSETLISSSNLIKNILEVLKAKGYIKGYEVLPENNYHSFKVKLNGKINELKVVKPRIAFKKSEIVKFKFRFLPGENVGHLLVSTPKDGVTTEREIEGSQGGIILGYVY